MTTDNFKAKWCLAQGSFLRVPRDILWKCCRHCSLWGHLARMFVPSLNRWYLKFHVKNTFSQEEHNYTVLMLVKDAALRWVSSYCLLSPCYTLEYINFMLFLKIQPQNKNNNLVHKDYAVINIWLQASCVSSDAASVLCVCLGMARSLLRKKKIRRQYPAAREDNTCGWSRRVINLSGTLLLSGC